MSTPAIEKPKNILSGYLRLPTISWPFILVTPYLVVFFLFVAYPILFGLWLGSNPADYKRLFNDPIYTRTIWNTLIFVVVGVNLKLLLALLLSGFFFIDRWWIRVLGVIFILPWAVPSIPTILSFRWMLNSEWGMLNNMLWDVFRIEGPWWLIRPKLALSAAIVIHIWKWLPFWTLILLAGRTAIPQQIYEAAAVDGATSWSKFIHITLPLLLPLYLTSVLLSSIWTLGDFNSIYLLTGGGPVDATHVLATLGIRYAFVIGDIKAGVGTAITALPFIIPLMFILIQRIGKGETS